MADGSIIIDTRLDTSGIQSELALLETMAQDSLAQVAAAISSAVEEICDRMPDIAAGGMAIVQELLEGLSQNASQISESAAGVVTTLYEAMLDNTDVLVEAGRNLILSLEGGLFAAHPMLIQKVPIIMGKLVSAIISFQQQLANAGVQLIAGLWQGISGTWGWLAGNLQAWCGNLVSAVKGWFGIHSPSRVMRDEVGRMLVLGLAQGIEKNGAEAVEAFEAVVERLEYQRDFDLIGDAEYFAQLAAYRDRYLTQGTKEYIDVSKKIYDYRKKQEDDAVQREFDGLKRRLQLGMIEEETYYDELARLRDRYFEEGTEEWEDYTYEIAKYNYKVLEAQKKSVEAIYKSLAEEAQRSLDEIDKDIEAMAKKLKEYGGGIVQTITIKGLEGESVLFRQLRDLSEDRKAIEAYRDALAAVRDRGGVSNEFLSMLRGMSIEEGTQAANLLLAMSQEEFDQYIAEWQAVQAAANEAAEMLYQSDIEDVLSDNAPEQIASKFYEKLCESFGEVPDDFLENGKLSAVKFGEGFVREMDRVIGDVVGEIERRVEAEIAAQLPQAASGGGSTAMPTASESRSYVSNTFNVGTTKNTVRETLALCRNFAEVQRLRGAV